jgi:hypothetical protein
MKTQTTPKVKFSTGRGRPTKITQINRRLSVNTEDLKDALALMHDGKSLTKIEKSTSLNLKSLRAIRKFAIDRGYIGKKEGISLANKKRAAKKSEIVEKVEPQKVFRTPDLFDLVSDSSPFKPMKQEVPVETPIVAQKTLKIDFKGIKIEVEIASIEVKDDTIVVR